MNNLHNLEPDDSRGVSTRGMALITTLLLLTVMMAMTLAMVVAVTSDTLITKYYRNARTAFYGGDSGVNIARAAMENSLTNAAITLGETFQSGQVPGLNNQNVVTALNTVSNYTTNTSILGGSAAGSWPTSFTVVASQSGTLGTNLAGCALGSTAATCSLSPCTGSGTCTSTSPSCQATSPTATTSTGAHDPGPFDCGSAWGGTHAPSCTGSCSGFSAQVIYTIPYTITALGQSIASEQQVVEDAGTVVITANFGTQASYTQSFAGWGMFVDQYAECSGSYLVPGTITGPVFTNGAWTFGNTGNYIFTGSVGSVSSTFGWNGSNGCNGSATYPQPGFSTSFGGAVNLGANSVPLPANDYNQKEAVVDGLGNGGGVTNAQMAASLKTAGGTAYPSTGTTSPGVYMPYSTSASTCGSHPTPCMTGGGIYVESSADSVVMTAASPTIGGVVHTEQVFTITQGATTTTITVDLTGNTTTMVSQTGSTITTLPINGVPDNLTGTSASEGVMLYVDGNINSLSGPSSGAAVANGSAITVDAGNGSNMTITGNITYASEPVTTSANQIGNEPADTLIPANNYQQVLGLYTAGGQINMNVPTSGQNLEIDASIASIVNGGSGGLENTGNAINTLTIVGGRIQNTIENINTTTRNVMFDQRFASGNFGPPWFPSTTVTPQNTNSVNTVSSQVTRTEWISPY